MMARRAWTDGRDIVDDWTDLVQLLWREMCRPSSERGERVDDMEQEFVKHINGTRTPWEVLMLCTPVGTLEAQGGFGGCSAEDLFWEWIEGMVDKPAELYMMTGWKEMRL